MFFDPYAALQLAKQRGEEMQAATRYRAPLFWRLRRRKAAELPLDAPLWFGNGIRRVQSL